METNDDLTGRTQLLVNFQQEYLKILKACKERSCDHKTSGAKIPHCPSSVWNKFSQKYQTSPSHTNNNTTKKTELNNSRSLKKNYRQFNSLNCEINKSTSTKAIISVKSNQLSKVKCNNSNEFVDNKNKNQQSHHKIYSFQLITCILSWTLWTIKFLGIVFIFLIGLFVFHKPTELFVMRNTQQLIYPIMRQLRLISLPIINHFPALTELYEDSCFIPNPYYNVVDVECWPCENVYNVLEFDDIIVNVSNGLQDIGVPFVVRNSIPETFSTDMLFLMYSTHKSLLEQEYLVSNIPEIDSFDKLLDNLEIIQKPDFQLMWKINRVAVSRMLRMYFPKPSFIPKGTEVAIQHFLYLDQQKSKSYSLPLTEFTNVFLSQITGSRFIVLAPTFSCQGLCKVVSLILNSRDILFYNWLYWRPVSFPLDNFNPSSSNNISFVYLGSFY